MYLPTKQEIRFLQSVGLLSWLCLVLFLCRILLTGQLHFMFVPWNLLLAWLALFFGWLLTVELKARSWSNWQSLGLTFIWLSFLPNSWYVLTDFIHVRAAGVINELYDIVLISSLVICGFTLGFASLYLVHKELMKRLGENRSNLLVLLIIGLSSFAIYLGRELRWNSWDVIANPSGILLNVSDRIINPLGHSRAVNITVLFFVLITGVYFAFWQFLRPDRDAKRG